MFLMLGQFLSKDRNESERFKERERKTRMHKMEPRGLIDCVQIFFAIMHIACISPTKGRKNGKP